VRGIHGALTELSQVSGASGGLLRLRDKLFPEGLAHTQKTYHGQAGHGATVAARLDAGLQQARRKAFSLHDKSLLDLVNGWLGVAKQLGDLEDERARLTPSPSSAADIDNARLGWVRIVSTPELAALTSNPEFSGVVWSPSRRRYLVVTDDSGLREKGHYHERMSLSGRQSQVSASKHRPRWAGCRLRRRPRSEHRHQP
jgi:hypothetical protein